MKKILVFLFLVVFFTKTSSVFADNSRLYVVPETNFGTPNLPELYANEGKTFRREGVTITVVPNTIPYDVYLTTAVAEKLGRPIRIGKYWQVTDVYEIWFRSFFNSARVENVRQESIIVIPYSESDLRISSYASLPEESLKVVCSPNGGETWTMERSSSVDSSANTVSALTKIGGGCMLMSGFVPVNQYNNYRSVRGAFTSADDIDMVVRQDVQDAPLSTQISIGLHNIFTTLFNLLKKPFIH
jgi:hypothetical protein